MNIKNLPMYRLVEQHYSEDVKSEAYLLEHVKSGARIAVLENDDDNKVFYIGFRTPPKDSTGVAHILEHSVLCGSEAFPLKDPFVELVKGSLNTFLNAMTYPDKTVYPVASCNLQDFKNLMHVYMDAVLHPNIYNEKKIFLQEGWHYELDKPEGELKINGVVYNEMKGAFSSPDDVLSRETFNSLFPDTSYGVESGGDPDVIPELTYEAFLDFHRKYYHPSNAYLYLYGDADMEERLKWLDENYLSQYDRITVDSHPGLQKPFNAPKYVEKEYPITENEKEENKTYLTYNIMIGSAEDLSLSVAMDMIDYAIISAEGTPLWKALTDAGIGTEIYASYDSGICQHFYSIVAKNANAGDEARFVSIIEDTLKKIVRDGIDENALLACLNSMEFRFREADSGRYPKGLIYGLKALDGWLYRDDCPFGSVEVLKTYAALREKIGTDHFVNIIQKYLIDNTHKTILKLIPKRGLTKEKDDQLAAKLADYKSSLGENEILKIIDDTKALKTYQETPDSPELIACLPSISVKDIRKEVQPIQNEKLDADGTELILHNIETIGIIYFHLLFDFRDLPVRLYPYVGLLQLVLKSVDTENYSYEQLGYEADKYTGCLTPAFQSSKKHFNIDDYRLFFTIQSSFLGESEEKAISLIREILLTSKLEDRDRLKEIIAEARSRIQGGMMSAGHVAALDHANAMLSEYGWCREHLYGLEGYRFLEDVEKNFDERIDSVIQNLKETAELIFRKKRLLVDVTAKKELLAPLREKILPLINGLSMKECTEPRGEIKLERRNEGFTTSAQVQYVCRVGNYKRAGLDFKGSMRVLKTLLGYQYLWTEVRVKGGAYGCMNNFAPTGEFHIVSYRDPHLENTLKIYDGLPDFIRNFDASEKEMERLIIGTFGTIDIPLSPRAKGVRSLSAYLEDTSVEKLQEIRTETLNTNAEDIRALAAQVEAAFQYSVLCVVGNEAKIKAAADLFDRVQPLF